MRAIVCSVLLVLPSCGIPNLRQAKPGPDLPPNFIADPGSHDLENSAQLMVEDFFNDPILSRLISPGSGRQSELKVMYEEVQIASNEILARSGAYLPSVGLRLRAGMDRFSRFTPEGAVERNPYLPGKHFPDPPPEIYLVPPTSTGSSTSGGSCGMPGTRPSSDLGRQRGAEYFVTRVVAEIAENYYALMALDDGMENLDSIIALQQQSLEIAEARMRGSPQHRAGRPAFPGRGPQEPEPKADHRAGDH